MKRNLRRLVGLLPTVGLFSVALAQPGGQPKFETRIEELPFARDLARWAQTRGK